MFVNILAAAAIGFAAMGGGAAGITEPAQVAQLAFNDATCAPNNVSGDGGWVCVAPGIDQDRECVIHFSDAPYRAMVVRDDSPICTATQLRERASQQATCDTDADCATKGYRDFYGA